MDNPGKKKSSGLLEWIQESSAEGRLSLWEKNGVTGWIYGFDTWALTPGTATSWRKHYWGDGGVRLRYYRMLGSIASWNRLDIVRERKCRIFLPLEYDFDGWMVVSLAGWLLKLISSRNTLGLPGNYWESVFVGRVD